MKLNEILGQKEVISGLVNAFQQDKVGHAYLFSGQKGLGKKTVARIFAGMLLCEKETGDESCGVCQACSMYLEHSNPDYFEIDTDEKSIGIEEIRKLQSDIIIRPMYSKRKIYVIIDGDKMTVQAQNCLLKILEEPPSYAVIIMTISNYDAILETVRSRSVRLPFSKNSPEEVRRALDLKLSGIHKDLDFIISYSDGVIGTALELAGSDEFSALREKTMEILVQISKSKLLDVFRIYDFFEANKNEIDTILDIMLLFYRDMLVLSKAGKENILINSDKKDIIKGNVSAWSDLQLVRNIEIIEQTRKNLKYNANYQLSIEVMLMKLREEYHSW
ncbi:MAG: DNA polymerase III subunit delta' [Clostridia bacterium]|nr:DNA polymerase III subunit delta' [Clostridia bacterium]